MLEGGCFCGAIRYQVDGTIEAARSCHCSLCRKIFSGAGSAYAVLSAAAEFKWVQGRDILKIHKTAEEWGIAFCSQCGSTLCGMHNEDVNGLTLGSVDGDPGVQIEKHIFVGSKASWDHIGGNAPQWVEHAEA